MENERLWYSLELLLVVHDLDARKDLVFAKDSLAGHLRQKGKKFVWFRSLRDVYEALKGLPHE